MFQRDDEWSVLFNAQHQALNRLFLFLLVSNHSVEKRATSNFLENYTQWSRKDEYDDQPINSKTVIRSRKSRGKI